MTEFADRATQLIADFQHAMDDNAPVNAVLMYELKELLATGVQAHSDCAAMHAKMAAIRSIITTEGPSQ